MFINTARAELADDQALAQAIEAGACASRSMCSGANRRRRYG